jgi:hypothetical protein
MNILKSLGAILAGIVFIVITHTLTDTVLESLGIYPPPSEGLWDTWKLLLAVGYRTVYNIGGGYVTASLAPSKPMMHVVILGLIGLVMSVIAVFVTMPMNLGPTWYPVVLAILAFPSVWLGGKLSKR